MKAAVRQPAIYRLIATTKLNDIAARLGSPTSLPHLPHRSVADCQSESRSPKTIYGEAVLRGRGWPQVPRRDPNHRSRYRGRRRGPSAVAETWPTGSG